MQRRLNKKLSDNLRATPATARNDRDAGGRRKPNKPGRGPSPPSGSEAAVKGTKRRTRPSRTIKEEEKQVEDEEEEEDIDANNFDPDEDEDDDGADNANNDDDDDQEQDDDEPVLRTKAAPIAFPQAPDSLPLDDQEFEEEFGTELLEKAFTDSDRGSQRDMPQRRSSNKSKGVEVQFVNERMAAFLPGAGGNNTGGSKAKTNISPSKRQVQDKDDDGDDDVVVAKTLPSRSSRKSASRIKSKTGSSARAAAAAAAAAIRSGTAVKPKSKSRAAILSPSTIKGGRSGAVGSKGFIVSGEEETGREVTRGWKWSQSQNQDKDDEEEDDGPEDEEEQELPLLTPSRRQRENVYQIEEEEEEETPAPAVKPVSSSKSKKNDKYGYPFAAVVVDLEEEQDEDEYEDIEEEDIIIESPPPPPPPRQRSKSSIRKSSRTSLRGNSRNSNERILGGSSDSMQIASSSSLVGNSRTRIGSSPDLGSASSLRASSRDNFGGRRTRSAKFTNDEDEYEQDMLGAESAIPNDINVGYQRSNPRLGSRSSSGSRGQFGRSRRNSREVTALPIEIPDSVTDEDAFRRYLSVRRGANITTRPYLPLTTEDANVESYSSVGEGGPARVPPAMAVRSSANANARLDTNRKTSCLCFAIVSLALLSASASQLRFVVAYSKAHAYPALNYFLICVSIIIEIVAGIGYVVVSRFPPSDPRIDNIIGVLIAGLFVVAINNVIISAFAFDDHVCEVLAKQTGMLDVIDQTPNQNQLTV